MWLTKKYDNEAREGLRRGYDFLCLIEGEKRS